MGNIPNVKIRDDVHAMLNVIGRVARLLEGKTQYEKTIEILEEGIKRVYPEYQAKLNELLEKEVKEE